MNRTAKIWLQLQSDMEKKATHELSEEHDAQIQRLKRLVRSNHSRNAPIEVKIVRKAGENT